MDPSPRGALNNRQDDTGPAGSFACNALPVTISAVNDPISSFDRQLISEAFTDPAEYAAAVSRAEKGEPVAYITGERDFFRETYFVTPDVLIPRPDTERVVEKVISLCHDGAKILDLCTGSGCIAVSVFRNAGCRLSVEAADISGPALAVARRNAERYSAGISFFCLDVTDREQVSAFVRRKKYDVIVSNPPYIDTDVCPELDASVRDWEPRIALDGGFDGMRFYRAILDGFLPSLEENGSFVFEIGYDQREKITSEAGARGLDCEVTRDWGGNDRVAVIRRKNKAP